MATTYLLGLFPMEQFKFTFTRIELRLASTFSYVMKIIIIIFRCEVRPGPEFILRSYSFMENNFFRLLQHFYDDESCIFPLHTVIAIGNLTLKGSSWVTPSGTEYEYSLSRVTIIPHTTEVSTCRYFIFLHNAIKKIFFGYSSGVRQII